MDQARIDELSAKLKQQIRAAERAPEVPADETPTSRRRVVRPTAEARALANGMGENMPAKKKPEELELEELQDAEAFDEDDEDDEASDDGEAEDDEDDDFDGEDAEFDDGEADDEDDEDDDFEEAQPAPPRAPPRAAPAPPLPAPQAPPSRAPRAPRAPRPRAATVSPLVEEVVLTAALTRGEQAEKHRQDTEDFKELLQGLDFGNKKFSITLARQKPEYYNGKSVTGYLKKYHTILTPEQIKAEHGGGTYAVSIFGPNKIGKTSCLGRKTIEIAGEPIIQGVSAGGQPAQADKGEKILDAMNTLISAKDADAKAAREEARAMQKQLLDVMGKGDTGMKEMMVALTTLLNPQTSRAELAEERRRQEEIRRQEMEERRREQEEQRRQHEKELQQQRQQHEKDMALMQQQIAKASAEAAQNAQKGESFLKEMMMMSEKLNSEREQRQRESMQQMMTMSQTMQQAQLQNVQALEQTKTTFLMDMLKQKDDGFGSLKKLLEFKELLGALNGSSEPGDGRATWEKVLDRISETAPSMVAAASAFMRPGATPAAQPQRALPAPQIAPGSMAVVDLAPAKPQQRRSAPLLKPRPPRAPPAQPPQVPAEPVQAALEVPSVEEPVASTTPLETPSEPSTENDLKEFVIPAATASPEDAVKALVQDIDLAIQRGTDSEVFFQTVVSKFPTHILQILKSASPEQMIAIVSNVAPATWLINTPAGAAMIQELYALLVTSEAA